MKFSENWLRSWVSPALDTAALGHEFTMAGLEVEVIEPVAPSFNLVVVGEVLEVVRHPNADRLNVCQVNVGEAQPLTIVCGASNVAAGIKVPCARMGAQLPGDFAIKQAKVRGVESFGMLCSAKELGLAAESEGLWILPADAPVGSDLRQYLDLNDNLLTLKLTPNRSDCLSIAGLAREVAALTGAPLQAVKIEPVSAGIADELPIEVAASSGCPLYCGRVIRGVNAAAQTPEWMVRRLERSGVRSINAVVDITNYVLLEQGQPLHAFDLSRLNGGINVRYARPAERLTLLNGEEIELQTDMLVIADQQRALALAGIMGGSESGVETATRDIFLESAFFIPDEIIGKGRRYNLSTDSSHRFERGVDFAATITALERASRLVLEICGGQAGPVTAKQGILPVRAPIRLRVARVARVLGIVLERARIADILRRLGFAFTDQGEDFMVTAPTFRFDMALEIDLIEEIARMVGYDNIPALPPVAAMQMQGSTELQRPQGRLRQLMVARDYQETISYAFVDAQSERDLCGNTRPVTLQNPIASQMAVMRSSLLVGLVQALRINLARKQPRVRLFEIGSCFSEDFGQTDRLAALSYGGQLAEQWGLPARNSDFYDAKADLEALFAPAVLTFEVASHPALHPGRSARVLLGTEAIGWLGELHPQWAQQYDMPLAPVWFEVEMAALTRANLPTVSEISKFPPVRRDIAVVADEGTTAGALLGAMQAEKAPFVVEIALFDVYRGKGVENGKKSLAFRVLLQDTQKTLTDVEIDQTMLRLIAVLQQQGAQLRV